MKLFKILKNILDAKNSVLYDGFNAVYHLKNDDIYQGTARYVFLVRNKLQILLADEFRKKHYSGIVVDIAVCEDVNVQQEKIGYKKARSFHSCANDKMTKEEMEHAEYRRQGGCEI